MKILVTGSSGLIGSEVVTYFADLRHAVYGIDSNMRADFFGPAGDTNWNRVRLQQKYSNYHHLDIDIRKRNDILKCTQEICPNVIVHAAAQPSHDLAALRPFDDFDVNAVGTMNLLEATRLNSPEAIFVFLSTNKVYGDSPNRIALKELPTRWEYDDPAFVDGIDENLTIDQSKHSIFGASKIAADIMVQEYGRYYGMKTCCLRGGCLTGPNHAGVELHGFLSYLVKVNLLGDVYNIFGYKGKQVRDNIHARDVAQFISNYIESPRCGEVYNLGGGRANSCSILEAFEITEQLTGKKMNYECVDKNREGDHICYISNLSKICEHYPKWNITIKLEQIFIEIIESWQTKGIR